MIFCCVVTIHGIELSKETLRFSVILKPPGKIMLDIILSVNEIKINSVHIFEYTFNVLYNRTIFEKYKSSRLMQPQTRKFFFFLHCKY